jgi:hypothetical protein
MVSHAERVARVKQAPIVHGAALAECERHGAAVAFIAAAQKQHSLFGPGDEGMHILGKIAEKGFEIDAIGAGCVPTVTPFPADGAYHLDYDFLFGTVACDVKGGWVLNQEDARGKHYKTFGMMVPTEKLRDADRSEYYVYCLCWKEADAYRVAPVGYATRAEVKDAPVRNNVRHICHVVPMSDLHAMSEFYSLVLDAGVGPAPSVKSEVELKQDV